VIEGETDEESPQSVMLRVDSTKMTAMIGDQPKIENETKADSYDAVSIGSDAGILPALDAWRRMIAEGPKKFGFGSMPLAGQRPLRDCMVGIDGELEVRWLSHPESRLVEVIEIHADRDADPAELWLIREHAEESTPSILELRYGVKAVLRIRVKSWKQIPESKWKQADQEEA